MSDYPTMAMPPAQEPELPPEEPKSGKAPIIIAVIVAIALGLGAGALWAARGGNDAPGPTESPVVTTSPSVSPTHRTPTTVPPTTYAPTTAAPTSAAPTTSAPAPTSAKPSKTPKPTDTITGPPLQDEVEPTEAPPSAVAGEGDFETGGAP